MEFQSGSKEGRLLEAQELGASAILVGTYVEKKAETLLHVEELASLAETLGLHSEERIVCPLRAPSAKTFLGKGKVEEIRQIVQEKKRTLVIFDDEISPPQQRNLEKAIGAMVVDRTELIIAVFAQRAHTKEAKTQVSLAQYQYQLPRLTRLWTHLGRQKVGSGSGGFLKGEGERQIEIDRRLLRSRITRCKKQIQDLEKKRALTRTKRKRQGMVSFAVVGYTNAGKSTLLNALTDAGVFVEDKLFATLDTKASSYVLPNQQKILLIDTVGFIRKLPHGLIAAFKSTLEEALHADVLLHLLDASSSNLLEEIEACEAVLKELGASNKPRIYVLNKTDLPPAKEVHLLRFRCPGLVKISAREKKGFQELTDAMIERMHHLYKHARFCFHQKEYRYAAKLIEEGEILSKVYEGDYLIIEANVHDSLKSQLHRFLIKSSPAPSE